MGRNRPEYPYNLGYCVLTRLKTTQKQKCKVDRFDDADQQNESGMRLPDEKLLGKDVNNIFKR